MRRVRGNALLFPLLCVEFAAAVSTHLRKANLPIGIKFRIIKHPFIFWVNRLASYSGYYFMLNMNLNSDSTNREVSLQQNS